MEVVEPELEQQPFGWRYCHLIRELIEAKREETEQNQVPKEKKLI